MPTFDETAAAVAGVPFMSPAQGRIVYDHVANNVVEEALELGTAHGVGAAYIAAALPSYGRLTTVDFEGAVFDPSPGDVLRRAGVADRVDIVKQYSSYTWWLKEEVQRRSDSAGNCEPRFDFIYLDGAKNFTIDGLAVVLAEKLLKPSGWLLMDDLPWRYSDAAGRGVTDGVVIRKLSAAERDEPHLRAVFDLIVAQHPSFTDLRIEDDWWGWARKAPGQPRRLQLVESRPPAAVALIMARRGKRAAERWFKIRRQ